MHWSHHERGRQKDYFKINQKFIILTVNSNFHGKLKALSLLSATHSNPQPGGPPMCASRVRIIGSLHYRPRGVEVGRKRGTLLLTENSSDWFPLRFISSLEYLPFIHFRFLHICFLPLFSFPGYW